MSMHFRVQHCLYKSGVALKTSYIPKCQYNSGFAAGFSSVIFAEISHPIVKGDSLQHRNGPVPKGVLYKQYGKMLERQGYKVRKLDFVYPEESCGYNFFRYIRTEQDILKTAHMLVYGEDRTNVKADPYWEQSAGPAVSAGRRLYETPVSEVSGRAGENPQLYAGDGAEQSRPFRHE